jgi:hypothetical protein
VSPAEVREVVADLSDETPTVMPDGRMRGQEWRPAGVHRRGLTLSACSFGEGEAAMGAHTVLADVSWYETALEWFGRAREAPASA